MDPSDRWDTNISIASYLPFFFPPFFFSFCFFPFSFQLFSLFVCLFLSFCLCFFLSNVLYSYAMNKELYPGFSVLRTFVPLHRLTHGFLCGGGNVFLAMVLDNFWACSSEVSVSMFSGSKLSTSLICAAGRSHCCSGHIDFLFDQFSLRLRSQCEHVYRIQALNQSYTCCWTFTLLFWAYWLLVWSIQPALEKSVWTCLQDTSFQPTLHVLLDLHATALSIVTSCLIADQFSYFAIFNCCLRLVRHTLEDNMDIWRTSSCSRMVVWSRKLGFKVNPGKAWQFTLPLS